MLNNLKFKVMEKLEKENAVAEELTAKKPAPVVFNIFDKEQFEIMQRVCNMFANSDIVPERYKISDKNPKEKAIANCIIAIEIAQRIGASTLMVMQNLSIIYGTPSWLSKFLIATINTCGRFNPLQYRFKEKGMLGKVDYVTYEKVWDKTLYNGKGGYKNVPKTETFDGSKIMDIECVAYTTAKGSDKVLESNPVSLRMAIQEGWYTKPGSKWPTMSRQMLMYRTASFWVNVYAPELSMGMKTVEEIHDIVDVNYEEVKNETMSSGSEVKENSETETVINTEDVFTDIEDDLIEIVEPKAKKSKIEKPKPEEPKNEAPEDEKFLGEIFDIEQPGF